MPIRKRARKGVADAPQVLVVPPTPPTPEEDDEREAEELMREEQAAADAVTADMPGRRIVRLFRSHPSLGGRMALTDTFDMDLFSQDYVQSTYGGGSYRADFFGPGKGKGGRPSPTVQIKTVKFDVDPSIPPRHPRQAVSGGVSNPDGTPAGSRLDAMMEAGLMSVFQSMQSQQQMQLAFVERLTTQRGPDFATLLPSLLTAIAPIIASLMQRKDPIDSAREIAALTQKTAPTADPMESLRAALGMIKELREMSPGGTPNADDDTPAWLKMLERVGGPVVEAVLANRAQQAGPTAATGEPHPPSLAALPPTQQPNENAPMNISLTMLRPILPQLVGWAQQGRSVEWAAETLLYDVPAGYHASIGEQLRDPGVVVQLTAMETRLRPFAPWLEQLRAELVANIFDDGSDDGEGTDTDDNT